MKRILLKISGEAFQALGGKGLDIEAARKVAVLIETLRTKGKELVIVVGGGNIYRGSHLITAGLSPTDSHNMSMLGTVFNALTLKNVLNEFNIEAIILDALHIEFLEVYSSEKGKKYLQQGKVLILSSGTGIPFFSTDTAGVLRALELHCDCLVKLTKVDGVYDSDPLKNPDAKKYETISYNDFLQKELQVFDQAGIILARDNMMPVYVSQMGDVEALQNILNGKKSGTKIF